MLEIAKKTKSVRIGPAAVNPFTAHPINIAGNVALIDAVSNGRAYCGFARGAWLDFIGLKPTRPIAKLREAMLCVRHLLRQDPRPLVSEHFPLRGGESLRWSGIRGDIPFLLGSWGQKTIQACLPLMSEIKLGGTANPSVVQWLKSILAQQSGHIEVVVGAVTVVDIDGHAARQLARREVALYLPVVAELDKTLAIEAERMQGIQAAMKGHDVHRAMAFISDELLSKFAFAGTPEEVTIQALNLFTAGADRIEFGTPHGLFAERGLALLGEIVLPEVRAALSGRR